MNVAKIYRLLSFAFLAQLHWNVMFCIMYKALSNAKDEIW